jgi:hypothetical protein
VKTAILLSALLLTSSFVIGMGYPQDMFAEHVTTKTVVTKTAKAVTPGKVKSQPVCKPTKSEESNKAAQPSSVGLPIQSTFRMKQVNFHQADMIAFRIFDLVANKVEEQTVTTEEFMGEQPGDMLFSQLLARFRERLLACLPGQWD